MTRAEDYESMANAVYFVDPLRQKPPRAVNETFYSDNDSRKQQWVVVNVSADASDGFQAMAVAPVMNGVRDDSRIFIAYAGTNPEDPHDLANDLGVGLSAKPAQANDAMAFAATVKKLHPTSKFETVGHSLGGYLAQYVAAENRWPATSFNGPDAWRIMSPAARAWLDKHNAAGTNPVKNYVNRFDTVGNSKGNRSGAGIFVDDVPHRPLLDYHNLGKNKKGKPQRVPVRRLGEYRRHRREAARLRHHPLQPGPDRRRQGRVAHGQELAVPEAAGGDAAGDRAGGQDRRPDGQA